MNNVALAPDSRKLSVDTQRLAQVIAQQLFSAHCHQEGVRLMRLEDVTVKEALPFVQIGEMAVQMALAPDLEQTAVVAAADVLISDSTPDRTIFDHDPRVQQFYIRLAGYAVTAYRNALRLVPASSRYHEQLCRLLPGGKSEHDAIYPDGGAL